MDIPARYIVGWPGPSRGRVDTLEEELYIVLRDPPSELFGCLYVHLGIRSTRLSELERVGTKNLWKVVDYSSSELPTRATFARQAGLCAQWWDVLNREKYVMHFPCSVDWSAIAIDRLVVLHGMMLRTPADSFQMKPPPTAEEPTWWQRVVGLCERWKEQVARPKYERRLVLELSRPGSRPQLEHFVTPTDLAREALSIYETCPLPLNDFSHPGMG